MRPDSLHISSSSSPVYSHHDVSIDMTPAPKHGGNAPSFKMTSHFPRTATQICATDDVFLPQTTHSSGSTAVTSPLTLEVPAVMVTSSSQVELCEKLNKLLEQNLSGSESESSSAECMSSASSVEQLESHQSTINSQTPLLDAQELKEIREITTDYTQESNEACINNPITVVHA